MTAVADAALSVSRGEIFVIMGLSGSGKSTLVRCLARLIEPTAGEVTFAGRDLLKASPKELIELRRHKMGMVFQHFALLPHLTVLDNVAFPLEIQGVARKDREARAGDRRELGLVTVCEEAGCPNLSDCWADGTATFMVLGERCTRACGFCLVDTRKPGAVDETNRNGWPRRSTAWRWTTRC